MRNCRRQQGQRANRPRLAPKAEEERQWKEEAISAAQAQPWRPSWERKPLTNPPARQKECSVPQIDESLVTSSKPWRPSWEKERPEQAQLKDLAPKLMPAWQPCAVANLRRRIWASKRFAESGSQAAKKLEELHLVRKCEDDTGDKDDIDAFSQSDAKTVATTSLHSEAGNESVSRDADVHSEQSYSELLTDASAAEDSLQHILARLQDESAQLSPLREWLFNTVRDAAKEALGENFERMILVGSVALQIDIPSSDVDAVTFTTGATGVDGIQALHATAAALRKQEPTLNVQVIATARVPILMVSTADHAVRMDMSVNQKLPDEHARWVGDLKIFREEQQIARDFLRSVKYWHSQRQIPGTKEGGYPALAWLFLALHVLTVHARGTSSSSQRPLKLLKEFFTLMGTDSTDGTMSKLTSWCAPPTWRTQGFWPFPSIQDPVTNMTSMTNSGGPHGAHFLTHEIPAATQLLYAAEFRRAQVLIAAAERTGSIAPLFEPRDRATSLPVAYDGDIALILKGGKIWAVEPLAVRQLRGGWKAPFLHRCDCQSQVRARVHGVDGRTGLLTPFPELRATMDFTPSEFVATVAQCRGERGVRRLAPGDLQLWQDMCQLLQKGEPLTSQL